MPASSRIIIPVFLISLIVICIFGCYPTLKKEASRPEDALTPVRYFYPTFHDDMDLDSLKTVIKRNLVYLNRIDPKTTFHYGPHQFTCRQVRESQEFFLKLIIENHDWKHLNRKIRKQFRVYRAAGRAGNNTVLFTGYFEPVFDASLTPDDVFKYPLYGKPDDLVKIDLSLFAKRFKDERIIARIDGEKVLPYYTRHQIEVGKVLDGKGLEIAWLRDRMDAVFLHIQGSGKLRLNDGKTIGVGYQAANGRPYRSIGRYMLNNGFLTRDGLSMQSIRKYLFEHPEVSDEVLGYNPSYIFFHMLEGEPLGNINVPLVPGRSLALDARLFPKGALAFVSSQKPDVDEEGRITGWKKFSRFVLNQDTGGAIKGAGRADLFWGGGPYAAVAAGHMKHEGELYILIKKTD
ncbi:MAG: MltA domain-containing protein [Deltaproteobacteria bacterium]|nr:MltA domain-containing protein [Deltaproteobacteria bacterium]